MKIISNTKNDSIKRVEEIYKVLKKNDFGYLIEENTFFKNFPFLKDTKRGKYKELPDESKKNKRCAGRIRTNIY